MTISRRKFVAGIFATAACSALTGCATTRNGTAGRVVVIGGGYGGATAARYVKLWAPDIDVTVIERDAEFVSCPLSNLVLGGNARMSDITIGYDGLRNRDVRIIRGEAIAVDPVKRRVRLATGTTLDYDRLIVSPGVEFIYDPIPALRNEAARERILHAWKAGPQTAALRRQVEAMRDGGVYVMHIPMTPFRCPPGPYERACQIADYFKKAKPRSKIIVLDSNPDLMSKKRLFLAAWNGLYKGMIDYQPNSEIVDVDVKGMVVKLQFDDVKGDVLNVVPPQRAADIALKTGLITANQRWCGIDWSTCESLAVKGVHVLGDATLAASAMPKSASMANQHAKTCAAAVIALIKGQRVNPAPMMMNTCYSFVDGKRAMHIASVHQYNAGQKTMVPIKGAGGLSSEASELEGTYAWGWARNIWAEALG